MQTKVPLTELNSRITRFREQMDQSNPGWELTAIISRINQYYFTGTMQDGVLFIPRDDEAVFWVRRSYERAVGESEFPLIRSMGTYRDAASVMQNLPRYRVSGKRNYTSGNARAVSQVFPVCHS